MIVSSEFRVDVVAFYHVQVCTFLLVVKDLHCVVYGAKGVRLFHEVLANFEMWLLFLNACLCSYRTKKLLSVWPTYAFLQSGHVSLYTPDYVYSSVLWSVVDTFVHAECNFYVGASE
jgi:uncharacterized membrane protein